MRRKQFLLGLGIILLVIVGFVVYSRVGVYGSLAPPANSPIGTATVTYASATSTVTGLIIPTSTMTPSVGTPSTSGTPSTLGCPQNCPPVKIFTEPGPIVSIGQYCQYYEEYYGVSNCDAGPSAGPSQCTTCQPNFTFFDVATGTLSGTMLLNLAAVTSNPYAPFVNLTLLIVILLVLSAALFLIFCGLKGRRKKRKA